MKSMNPYLTFAGNCREALNFYKEVFGGEVSALQTYGEGGMAQDEKNKDAVLHSEFRAPNLFFMAADDVRGFVVRTDNNISLMVDCDSAPEQDRIFNKLAEGGNVTLPLADTFWGARFGQVTDRFGIQWMSNYTKPQ